MSFGSILSLVSTTGVVEVHLLGDSNPTVEIVPCFDEMTFISRNLLLHNNRVSTRNLTQRKDVMYG